VDIRDDRREGVDGSLRCDFGRHQGTTIAYAAQTGERITRPGAGPRPGCSGWPPASLAGQAADPR
jgi:hypothetical protein